MVDSNISVTGAEIVDDIFVGIEKLKAVGAKHLLLNSIPDIGRTPFGSHAGEKLASVLTATTLDLRKALFSAVDAQTVTARNMPSMDARMVLSNGMVVADMFRAADEIYRHALAYGLSKTAIS